MASATRQRGMAGSAALWIALAVLIGAAIGVGGYTLVYAEGLSYMSSDPKVCVNCHIMRPQYEAWQKSSHHNVAGCVECHLPQGLIGKYLAKAMNGYHHSKAFTLQDFAEPIAIKPGNSRILQDNCLACHGELVHQAVVAPGRSDEVRCVHCHQIGRARRARRSRRPLVPDHGGSREAQIQLDRAWPSAAFRPPCCWSLIAVVAIVAAAVTALLMNIFERKQEAAAPFTRARRGHRGHHRSGEVGRQLAQAVRLLQAARRRPRARASAATAAARRCRRRRSTRDPWLKRMFLGYAFSIDYRDRRGHAYMLTDQEQTQRLTKPQTGSCLHCHASVMPLYRELGDGDAHQGLRGELQVLVQGPEQEAARHRVTRIPVTCVDCHDPKTMQLRVTRPGFIQGIQALATSDAAAPHLPSIERWRASERKQAVRPQHATPRAPRCVPSSAASATSSTTARRRCRSPSRGARACVRADQETFWNETKFANGERFFDYKHAETGAPILKAQHPGVRAVEPGRARAQRRGLRRLPHALRARRRHQGLRSLGAQPAAEHQPRLPDLPQAVRRARSRPASSRSRPATPSCCSAAASPIVALIDAITAAKKEGATPEQLQPALELQRQAQWRLDFIAAENSMGFHAPQEAAMVLGEALDYARQGELAAARRGVPPVKLAAAPAAAASAAPAAPAAPAGRRRSPDTKSQSIA